MLANLNDVLSPAKKAKYAVGLFNAVNLELVRGVIEAAERERSPVIMGTAEVLLPFGPLEELSWLLVPMARRASVPVVVHFDHGLTDRLCVEALKLGFSSIMYDCSTDAYEDNVRKAKEMAYIAHCFGATIEAELGHVGGAEGTNGSDGADPSALFTDPEQAVDFVSRTGVDALAIAVGTAHGHYKSAPKLDFGRIAKISSLVNVPLVLHGGSGLTDEDFRTAIARGIAKVNIFTDVNTAGATAAAKLVGRGGSSTHGADAEPFRGGLTDLIPSEVAAIADSVAEKMRLFGSTGKA
jgi:fructose-bisphosphate aldolase, class II